MADPRVRELLLKDYNLNITLANGSPAKEGEDYIFSVDKKNKPVIKGMNTPLNIKTAYEGRHIKVTLDNLPKGSVFTGSYCTDTIDVNNSSCSKIMASPTQSNQIKRFFNSLTREYYKDKVNVTNSNENEISMPNGGEVSFDKNSEQNTVISPKAEFDFIKVKNPENNVVMTKTNKKVL